ncbi:transporter substrate-binding domain-containing protein [Actinokineospora terrae]|uniref:transporter substrate-binding domain-containing protein n=1 Tax=Actinokineospora terrae TaxID=155974 RepID=UPI0015A54FB3|nr:transporter substrate-binding domain-containing protein [Actinokineospora terrae]
MTFPPVPGCPTPDLSLNPAGLAAGTKLALNRIRHWNGRLVVGLSQTTRLFSSRSLGTGELSGFEVDIARRIASELFGEPLLSDDARLHLVDMPTGGRLYSLDTAENQNARLLRPELLEIPTVDLVISNVKISCTRASSYGLLFSAPYLSTNTGLLVRAGDREVRSPDGLGGRKVCSGTGTTDSSEMIEIRDQQSGSGKPAVIPVSVADTSECLMLLQRGLVDAIYSDILVLEGFRLQDPSTVLLPYRSPGASEAGIAMSDRDPDLVRFVNGVLDEMRSDGSLAAAYDRWFATVPDRLPIPVARYSD